MKTWPTTRRAKARTHEAYLPDGKASWLQTSRDITNPYMGIPLLTCALLKE